MKTDLFVNSVFWSFSWVEKALPRMIDQVLAQAEHNNSSITKRIESKSNITIDKNTAGE
jgi:hypothetical protein